MPRSDDWTIHMRPSLIKRWGGAGRARTTHPNSPQPGFASRCLASLIPERTALRTSTKEDLGADGAARFFLREGRGVGALDFRCLASRGKQLKYSLN